MTGRADRNIVEAESLASGQRVLLDSDIVTVRYVTADTETSLNLHYVDDRGYERSRRLPRTYVVVVVVDEAS